MAYFGSQGDVAKRVVAEQLAIDHAFGLFKPGQLRTLERRVKGWSSEVAHELVFGTSAAASASVATIVEE